MLDRESTFAEPETIKLLQSEFIPVAIDQAYQRRQKDTEGDFYRKIAGQGPRNDFQNGTTQGNYVATPSGQLLLYNNNRDPKKLLRLIKKSLTDFKDSSETATPIQTTKVDQRYNVSPPEGGLVLRVHTKILSGYEPTDNRWKKIYQAGIGRDNLWISKAEHAQLVSGKVPPVVVNRVARFHLVDNTRGEPPMWKSDQIQTAEINLASGALSGEAKLRTSNNDRGYDAKMKGELRIENGKVTKMDLVVLGQFWGEGRYTPNGPKGKFPLAITFSLADGKDIADKVPPQGSRGWIDGYMQSNQ